ncbi:hypothetical protein NN3_01320 [Nocardia neocaledoniensis NBRC 108232]|uniref:Uncharacterized protein n=1 Tax=Nocardia neocaledoniensis TaxID=236511 RepID=A0A317NH44_9NOCA|nr:hypothetical protein [Nocardia neocaledoniensis]PWV74380.1 hypothetical protein DFR69_106191 [Nocardia neocaledoniensis]GEM29125.1 hypothetical protein NN3_01320 [Nocardia neocaledoniensis NBRC 108232]
MTYPLTVPPLRHRVRAALNQLRGLGPVADPVTGSTESTMVVAALHEARHNNLTVTIRTRGGHLMPRLRVDTVGARHASLSTDAGEQLIVPLRFIESVQHQRPTTNGDQGLL